MKKIFSDSPQKDAPALTKVAWMDQRIASTEKIDGPTICTVIREVYGLDLSKAPLLDKDFEKRVTALVPNTSDLSAAAVDLYIEESRKPQTGPEVRALLNHIFGTNLEGISQLHERRISLYSKDQWIVQNEKDLFIVHTGKNDIDVKVIPTPYFIEKTGTQQLPEDLQQALRNLGFTYDEEIGAYYYANPSGQSVPDPFKRQTMGAIHQTIQASYTDL
ncbi:hypothetical protein QWY22_03345 [Planococcus liqunii]|uniref:Uncharacterized protein n=1 Tax=Planococcus liqunii TaxID=3058394 RepID=A0ABT8MQS9_9BACL|nr:MULTISPECIES: hypothetical protein [unclassified Planococcus (in: firmicutes)]MDN7227268.1 hypothetical protein [Planococcus sp. N064]WKA51652.1 hypothetical protein QWY22_03345 [Planococcus sp. N056]